jgi:hypothetical protein
MEIFGTATENLDDVIQTLSLARKTGVLTVQIAHNGASPELGTITFQHGQVIDARFSSLRGVDALRKLIAGGSCQFVFQATSSTTTPSPLSSLSFNKQKKTDSVARQGYQRKLEDAISGVPRHSLQFQKSIPDFQHLGLSRTHRQLFLLIDGKRPVPTLVRLLGRHIHEVLVMLADLEDAGLISQ